MKKCTKCNFETEHDEYKTCPICGEKLADAKETHIYMVGITQGNSVSTPIRLTNEEANLIRRISKELSQGTNKFHVKLYVEDL